jgi:radical SAM superfamily enzyme YgiQ (UPF0313 family)
MGLPGETHETINNTIKFAKELDVETIQVSVAHAYPGTELYDYAVSNGFMVGDNKMVDEGGHQLAQIQYPGLPADDIMSAVHRFYDEYYFRPKAVFRSEELYETAVRAQQTGEAACRRGRSGRGAGESVVRQVSKFHVSRFQGVPLSNLFETLKPRNLET